MRKAFDKIILRIAKMLIPDAKQLSVMAAQAVRETINSLPYERSAKLMKSSQIASEANKVVEHIAKWLADGKMSDEETQELANVLKPLLEMIREKI